MLCHGLEPAEQIVGNTPALRASLGQVPALQPLEAGDELRPVDPDGALTVLGGDQLAVEQRNPRVCDLAPALLAQLGLQPRPQHPSDDLLGVLADPRRDQPGGNEQVLPIGASPPHQHMAMRIVGIPVVNRQPFQLGSELAFQTRHHFPDEGLQIAQRLAVLGRDDQPEMQPVLRPAGGDRLASMPTSERS